MSRQHDNDRKLVALLLIVVAWSGVLLQFWLSLKLGQPNSEAILAGLLAFFGFFTVLTNIFVAMTLTMSVFAPSSRTGKLFAHDHTWACAATSIALVGMAYHFLLRDLWNPVGVHWLADQILHYVTPTFFCFYWLMIRQKAVLPWWSPLLWSTYPMVYFIYVLVRGSVIGNYPYPFIDVTSIGYLATFRNALGLLIAFVLSGWVFLLFGDFVNRKQRFHDRRA